MESKIKVTYPLKRLNKLLEIIQEFGFNTNEFKCPEYNTETSDYIIADKIELIGFTYLNIKSFYFCFSQILYKDRIRIQFYPSSEYHSNAKLIDIDSFEILIIHFRKWLSQIKIHNDELAKNKELTSNKKREDDIENIPPLYKYKHQIDDLKQLLKTKSLALSNPKFFTDETDCRITFPNYNDMIQFCLDNLTTDANSIIEKNILSQKKDIELVADDLYDWLMDKLTDMVGVYCLTEKQNDSKFWEIYANKNDGYCIEFDLNNLYPNLKNLLFTVDYKNESSVKGGKFDLEKVYTIKKEDYADEKERRIIKLKQRETIFENSNSIHIECNYIKTITFGYKFSGSPEEIRNIAIANGFDHIKYFKNKKTYKGIIIEELFVNDKI